ncbi:uncharacterized protein N7479_004100 [Penicillium vulpinum]|uniref:uncharacterized protein n=1 Tax=Penicillium vulpinum TaxID=29845 RepID=UPI0025498C09|nr:uncharacterized protein N7479_004100 [Penicillium vulpinum]KAJ5964224.1 hypothetical protein N7479_004100 [Penicillium vulpinum]
MKKSAWVPGVQALEDRILDDELLYAFEDGTEDSWRRILVRMPGLTDFKGVDDYNGDDSDIQYRSGLNDEEILAGIDEEEDEDVKLLSRLDLEAQTTVYLLDREAITTGMIKVIWVNENGQSVWDNVVKPGTLGDLTLAQDYSNLVEIVNYQAVRGALIVR